MPENDPGQITWQPADIAGDRHTVVIEYDHHGAITAAHVVQRLQRNAARQRTVAEDRYCETFFPAPHGCCLDPERRRNGSAGMTAADGVGVRRFPAGLKGCTAVHLAQRAEKFLSACQQFVAIRLVADIPDQHIIRRMKDPVQGNGQLHDPEIGGEVTSVSGNGFQNDPPHFLCQKGQLIGR